jgi:hypothetical protein
MTDRIANRDARPYVRRRRPFVGSNHTLTAKWTDDDLRYVVYSYGSWPLFVYDAMVARWFENKDRYSVTTSKHRTQTHPHPIDGTTLLSKQEMVTLAAEGIVPLVALKLNPPTPHFLTETT